MSQAGVGMVVEKLLTDEDLRIRFALDRMETIAELCLRGIELTRDEIRRWDDWVRANAVSAGRTSRMVRGVGVALFTAAFAALAVALLR